jgi:hypothetical protein
MKHHTSILFWKLASLVGGNLNLRIHRILWSPAWLGATMMNWWRKRDYEYTNPGIGAHGAFPWEAHTGQRRFEGFYSSDTDPLFIVWKVGFRLHTLGGNLCRTFTRWTCCDCDACSCED